MKHLKETIAQTNWQLVSADLQDKGYALVPDFLTPFYCEALLAGYNPAEAYRKTIVMERYRFGMGEYKYFNYPLPAVLQTIREEVYPHIVPVANSWMNMLGIEKQFPVSLAELQQLCHANNQTKPTVLILKYGRGGHNTLHQDLYGEIYFPMQLVLFLNEPGTDYTGGEFVLLQQTPRAQSKATVLQPKKGDMLLFATQFRPVTGSRGYYRANIKHGVSELHAGERHTVGVIFHDALS